MENTEVFMMNNECLKTPSSPLINYEGSGRVIDRYRADLPYPPIEGVSENKHYACLVKSAYCGPESEMTAVLQYFYYSCQLKDVFDEGYKDLKYIAIVEMEHMDMLARLVMALGGDACYTVRTSMGESYWNAKIIKCSKTPRQIILESIVSEEAAIDGYMELCRNINDEAVTSVIQRIVMDERCHLDILRQLYKKII